MREDKVTDIAIALDILTTIIRRMIHDAHPDIVNELKNLTFEHLESEPERKRQGEMVIGLLLNGTIESKSESVSSEEALAKLKAVARPPED